ncbi:MAG: hypothetical protein JW880_00285 [Candidatus Thermoplasmatota archaeon]|nr:hypothetical protein [Candidatus Thermoplasmatota archaeon]
MEKLWIALAIVPVTYALISIRPLPKVRVDRAAAALVGAGLMIILGAAANIIVVEKAEAQDVEVNFWKFTLVGFPIALVTLFVSTVMLMVMF